MSDPLGLLGAFYECIRVLQERCGGYRFLSDSSGRSEWSERGVYFFFESGETRLGSEELRIVRVGTHALREGSGTTLWKRLAQHRGNRGGARPGGGNHRGSIFRLHVGIALLREHPERYPSTVFASWDRRTVTLDEREQENMLEQEVSDHIGAMPFLWIEVPDEPSPHSLRAYVERNSLALLSNHREPLHPPSPQWLGRHSNRQAIRESGLWNVNHVDEEVDADFPALLGNLLHGLTE